MKIEHILLFIALYIVYKYGQSKSVKPAALLPVANTSDAKLRADIDEIYSIVNERIAQKLDSWQVATKAAAVTLTGTLTRSATILVLADESQVGSPRALYFWNGTLLEEFLLL
jgi:hypothetical protein